MRLPNAGRAAVDIAKLRDYSLNVAHEIGKHKARVFQAALGLTVKDADWLRGEILRAAHEREAVIALVYSKNSSAVVGWKLF